VQSRRLPLAPGASDDMCRKDLAFASDSFGNDPGTPRMEYDFTGIVAGIRYELTWQIVPWHGGGTYTFGPERTLKTWLYLMSLPDHDVYLAPGGTVTVAPDG